MWLLVRHHVAAFAICLAALLCPRALWDRARIAALAVVDGRTGPSAYASEASTDRDTALRAEWARAEAERAALERALAQATALREAAPGVRGEAIVPAAVLGGAAAKTTAVRGAASRGARVRIDAGRRAGVEEGFAVVDGACVVGRIAAAGESAAEVELVTSPALSVRCRNARTGEEWIVCGAGDGLLRLHRPESATPDVRPGDAILTSAWSGFAPPNLTIGEVEEVVRDAATGLPGARVRPAAALARLERVLVIRRARASSFGLAQDRP